MPNASNDLAATIRRLPLWHSPDPAYNITKHTQMFAAFVDRQANEVYFQNFEIHFKELLKDA